MELRKADEPDNYRAPCVDRAASLRRLARDLKTPAMKAKMLELATAWDDPCLILRVEPHSGAPFEKPS